MLDPRTRLLLALAYAVLITLTRRPPWLVGEWIVLLAVIAALRQLTAYLRWLRMLIPMTLFFGAVTAWSAGYAAGLTAAMGLLTVTTLFFVFFATTDPEDLGNSLVQAGLPFAVAFVVTAALQFVPVVGRRIRSVIETQQARGIVLQPGWRALRNYPALLVPLLSQCFQMADNLAEAMETRGFGRAGRSFRTPYRMHARDWLAIAAGWSAVALVLFFLAR